MTKPAPLIDHIGWDLWRAAAAWKAEFSAGMVEAGHLWFAQARGGLIQHIGPDGVRQQDLVIRTSLTKQAVQQFIDELIADGIVLREADPSDGRAKWIRLTAQGNTAMHEANRVKLAIEARYRDLLGTDTMVALALALRKLAARSFD